MLTKIKSGSLHNEIVINTDTLCAQIESGNPFASNQDLVFSQKNRSFDSAGTCNFKDDELYDSNNVFHFFEEGLKRTLGRLKKHPNSRSLLNLTAQNYIKYGNIDKAIEYLHKALAIDDSFFPALANLAECYVLKNNTKKALELYDKLERIKERDERVLTNKALLLLKNQDYDSAIETLKIALKTNNKNSSILNNIGVIYLSKSKPDSAVHFLREAAKINPTDFKIFNNLGVAFVANNNPKKALKNFKIAYSLNRFDRNVIKNLINSYHKSEDFQSIIEILDDYLTTHQSDNELRDFYCYSIFKLESYKKCYKELLKSLNYIKSHEKIKIASVYNNIAVVADKMGFKSDAENYFKESLELNPKPNIQVFYNIIGFFFERNDFTNAKVYIDSALELFKNDSALLTYLARYYLFNQKYEEAISNLTYAIQLDKKNIDAYLDLSVIESEVYENNPEAINILNKALQFYPDHKLLLNNHAYCNIKNGNLDEAKKSLDKVSQADDFCLNATKGLLYLNENNLKEGRRYYNRAAKLAGKNTNLYSLVNQKKYLELGEYYLRNNNIRLALQALRKGKEFNTIEPYYKNKIIELYKKYKNVNKKQ